VVVAFYLVAFRLMVLRQITGQLFVHTIPFSSAMDLIPCCPLMFPIDTVEVLLILLLLKDQLLKSAVRNLHMFTF